LTASYFLATLSFDYQKNIWNNLLFADPFGGKDDVM